MARVIVTEPDHGTESPFLRGILTRSLQEAGMSFDQAYSLSSEIRQDLLRRADTDGESERVELSVRQLQARIIKYLRRADQKSVLERYRSRRSSAVPVAVEHKNGQITPFSRSYHQQGLQSCGLSSEEAAMITLQIYQQVLDEDRRMVTSRELDRMTHASLQQKIGDAVAKRYLVWRDFELSGRPLLLLLGGAAGCGKSTVATAVASRLGIVRTQSTDMLREVMRVMVPERLLPVLHTSSFDAWKVLSRTEGDTDGAETLIARGYQAQAKLISVACEAVVQRAIRERVSLILEGVHVQPSLIRSVPEDSDALVVPIMLGVLNARTLRARIRGRGSEAPGRRAARYLEAFDAIWQLQSHLLSEADRASIPIVRNIDVEQVFMEVMRIILDRLSVNFSRKPEDVFAQPQAAQTVLDEMS
jgi:2-phosphoglycerate kinase